MPQPYHLDGFLPGVAYFGTDADGFQHQLRMLTGHFVVIHHQDAELLRTDIAVSGRFLFPVIVGQCHGNRKGAAFSFFTLHLDLPVHHLHDVLRDGQAQPSTPEFIGGGRVFLREGIEDLRQELFFHPDAGIPDSELEGGLSFILSRTLYVQVHFAPLRGEFHGIAQDIQKHLFQLHTVADIIIIHLAIDQTLVAEAVVLALAADHGVDLFQQVREGEFFVV